MKAKRIGIFSAVEIHGGEILSTEPVVRVRLKCGAVAEYGADGKLLAVSPKRWYSSRKEATIAAMAVSNTAVAPQVSNPVILTVSHGFYFFGDRIQGNPDYITLTRAAMFGGFSGGKGMPGVARGDSSALVTLDRFDEDALLQAPLFSGAVLSVVNSINLYAFGGTTIR